MTHLTWDSRPGADGSTVYLPKYSEDCQHTEVLWRLESCNEAGWDCADQCQANLGFRPDLDRSHVYDKVRGILIELHEAKFLYVSNGTEGMVVADNVAQRCQRENLYDQYSIVRFIFEDGNVSDGHAAFWQKQATEVLLP